MRHWNPLRKTADGFRRFAEEMAEGARRTALKAARNFIQMGILPEQVAKGTELSLDEVLHLKEEIAADTVKNR